MRLYLSSFQLGGKTDELVRLFGRGKRVAVVANANDLVTKKERAFKVQTEYDLLRGLGFKLKRLICAITFQRKRNLERH